MHGHRLQIQKHTAAVAVRMHKCIAEVSMICSNFGQTSIRYDLTFEYGWGSGNLCSAFIRLSPCPCVSVCMRANERTAKRTHYAKTERKWKLLISCSLFAFVYQRTTVLFACIPIGFVSSKRIYMNAVLLLVDSFAAHTHNTHSNMHWYWCCQCWENWSQRYSSRPSDCQKQKRIDSCQIYI